MGTRTCYKKLRKRFLLSILTAIGFFEILTVLMQTSTSNQMTDNIHSISKNRLLGTTDANNKSFNNESIKNSDENSSSSSPTYLFWVQKGRLGNFLCQFAGTYCLALKSGRIHTIEKDNEFRHLFPNIKSHVQDYFSLANYQDLWRNKTISHLYTKYSLHYHPFILEFAQNHTGNLAFSYYFECWQYYTGCEAEIKEALKFPADVQEGVNRIISNFTDSYMKRKNMTEAEKRSIKTISIHIRRGDRSFRTPPPAFFIKAIQTFHDMYSHPLFFITTDDIPWWQAVIRNNSLSTENLYTSTNTDDFMQDFVLLASCNHSIIGYGTYGWFAAWFHGGPTIVYGNRWGSTSVKPKSRDCFMMPHWIEIFV